MKPEAVHLPALPISIAIPVHHCGPREDAALREAVGSYCRDLVEGLELPVRPEVTISSTDTDKRLRVVVGKSAVTVEDSREKNLDSYVQAVCRAIYHCRGSLVTEDVARQLRIEWFPKRASSVDEARHLEALTWLLKEATRYGLRAGRLRSAVVAEGAGFPDRAASERTFEEIAGELGPGSVCIFVSRSQHARCFDGGNAIPLTQEDQDLPKMLDIMTDGLFSELGILYRLEAVDMDDRLNEPWFRVQCNDVPAPPVKGLAPGEFLVDDTVDRLTLLNLKGLPAINPANGAECAILSGGEDIRNVAIQAGLTTWGPEGYLVLHAASEIRSNAGAFMNLTLFDFLIAQLSRSFPDLVNEAISRLGRVRLSRILRLLGNEETSVRDLRTVFNSLLAVDGITAVDPSSFIIFPAHAHFPCPTEKVHRFDDLRPEDYADCARMALRRYLSHKYTRGGNTLVVYIVDRAIEERLAVPTPLSSSELDALLDAVLNEVGSLPPTTTQPVLLTTFAVRRRLRGLIQHAFPTLAVLSYQELRAEIKIQAIARITLNPDRSEAKGQS